MEANARPKAATSFHKGLNDADGFVRKSEPFGAAEFVGSRAARRAPAHALSGPAISV